MRVRAVAESDTAEIAALCSDELILDQDARTIPTLLLQRPNVCLVAVRESGIAGVCIGSRASVDSENSDAFLDLFVVRRADQRQGIARQLVGDLERRLASEGCRRIRIAGNPPRFAWPGIDIHYTAAVCFAEDLGYRRGSCEVNMDVDLESAPLDTQADTERLQREGVQIRPANYNDDGPLQKFLASGWAPSWAAEVTLALRGRQGGLFVACQGSQYVGFCAYGVNRTREVGPIGTASRVRHLGVGRVLLRRCLAEQRDRGLTAAEIGWVGPLSFFARTVQAKIGRAFWLYQKDLKHPNGS